MSASPIARNLLTRSIPEEQLRVNATDNGGHQSMKECGSSPSNNHDSNGTGGEGASFTEDADDERFGVIEVAHFRTVPGLRYHGHLIMFSSTALSQEEYESVILVRHRHETEAVAENELARLQTNDEVICIECPGRPGSPSDLMQTTRTALERSPPLKEFFTSSGYVCGCGTLLHFPNDYTDNFKVTIAYLEEGPDNYTIARLQHDVTVNRSTREAFTFLFRLHKLATKLELLVLVRMIFEILDQIPEAMEDKSIIIDLAQTLFTNEHEFDDDLKNWLLALVNKCYKALKTSLGWYTATQNISETLKTAWAEIQEAYEESASTSPISPKEILFPRGRSSPSTVRLAPGSLMESAYQRSISMYSNDQAAAGANEGPEIHGQSDDITVASDEDGFIPPSTVNARGSIDVPPKARAVLGISEEGDGLVVVKAESGLTRSGFSFRNLVRRS